MSNLFPISEHKWLALLLILCPITFLAGYFLATKGVDLNIAIGAFVTLVAAFGGAYLAFLLQEKKELQKSKQENVSAARMAQFILFRMCCIYEQLNDSFPPREHPFFYLEMQYFEMPDYEFLRFDKSSLGFILDSQNPDLLNRLISHEESFHQLMRLVEERSAMYVNEVAPIMESGGVRVGDHIQKVVLIEHLGERLFDTLVGKSTDIMETCENYSRSAKELLDKFDKNMQLILPNEKLLAFSLDQETNV